MPQLPAWNPLGTPFIELQSVDSTNNYAHGQLYAGLAQHGAAFFAHEQFAGKGQRGKAWVIEKDCNLILSLVIDPGPLSSAQQFQLSACIANSVHELFSSYAGDDTRIKWPNDLYWQDRKAGGILIENVISSQQSPVGNGWLAVNNSGEWKWAIAGVGININQGLFPNELKNPVSLRQITGKTHDPVALAKKLCEITDKNFQLLINKGFSEIYAYYLRHLYKLDQEVKLKKGSRIFKARIKTVTANGHLVVEHGIEEEFDFGQVEWVIPKTDKQ